MQNINAWSGLAVDPRHKTGDNLGFPEGIVLRRNSTACFTACLNNRWQSHFSYLSEVFSCFHCWLLHTCRISIAVAIRFLYPTLGAFRGWCAVRTLQTVLFKQALNDKSMGNVSGNLETEKWEGILTRHGLILQWALCHPQATKLQSHASSRSQRPACTNLCKSSPYIEWLGLALRRNHAVETELHTSVFRGISSFRVKCGGVRENRSCLSPQGTDCVHFHQRRETLKST